jgi:DNA-binding CsgD family transcriptional regulator
MSTLALPLEPLAADDPLTVVNEFVSFQAIEGTRVVFVEGHLFFQYEIGDRDAEAFLIATLARGGQARVKDLARAFDVDPKTVYRYRTRLEKEGTRGVLEKKRGPKGAWKVDRALRRRMLALKEEGLSAAAVGRRLGISRRTVGRVLREEGYRPPEPPSLPGLEPAEEEQEVAPAGREEGAESEGDEDADEREGPAPRPVAEAVPPRVLERALAARGLLAEAAPVLVPGENLRGAGLLLALPCLLELGIFSVVKKVYQGLRPGFYSLRSLVLTLLFMALFRVKRPEGLKALPPEVLGRMLGLDRSPEVKTVRRKLTEIAARGRSHEFVSELARRLRQDHEDLLGFLYVDGHVRAYHGRREIPKTWVPGRRLCLPATTDYWVSDAEGDPFFFVTSEGNPSLSKVLPGLMEEVKGLFEGRRATVIFDRGGWSQKALKKIVALGFDFITYRRRPYDDLDEDVFEDVEVEGRKVSLAEGTVTYGTLKEVRLVAKRDPDGTQVHIVTSAKEEALSTGEVYLRMARRWRQENFFKYMKEELALDVLLSYEMVPADGDRLVPNPKWKDLDRQVRAQRRKVKGLEQKLGSGSREPEQGNRPTMRGFKASIYETGRELAKAEEELARLLELRGGVAKRVPLKEAVDDPPMRLEFERKVFTDAMKMMAYRAETALVNAVTPEYRRARHEARKLVQEALHASGDLEVKDRGVTVRLEPLSSPHRTRALRKLCTILSDKNAVYPGTKLRLRYELRPAPDRAE